MAKENDNDKDVMTADEAVELTLRIQAEGEEEAAKLIMDVAKRYYMRGFSACEVFSLEEFNKLHGKLGEMFQRIEKLKEESAKNKLN